MGSTSLAHIRPFRAVLLQLLFIPRGYFQGEQFGTHINGAIVLYFYKEHPLREAPAAILNKLLVISSYPILTLVPLTNSIARPCPPRVLWPRTQCEESTPVLWRRAWWRWRRYDKTWASGHVAAKRRRRVRHAHGHRARSLRLSRRSVAAVACPLA